MVWITESLSFINWTKQFKMQGPIRRRIIKGPIKEDNIVINQGDLIFSNFGHGSSNQSGMVPECNIKTPFPPGPSCYGAPPLKDLLRQ